MNNRDEARLLDRALQQLHESVGIYGHAKGPPKRENLVVEFKFPHCKVCYEAKVKTKIDRFASLAALKPIAGENSLLVTSQLSAEMAAKCRELDIQFIDAAGNTYLNNGQGIFVFVSGRRDNTPVATVQANQSSTPATLRVTFVLLARRELLNAPLREIAEAAGVSVGLATQAVKGLAARGFLAMDGSRNRAFLNRRQLAIEWAAGYVNRLYPKLPKARFSVPDPEALERLKAWEPQPGVSAWGGEMAAAHLTKHLKPSTFTLYKAPDIGFLTGWMVKHFKLKADPAGELEIVDAFWNSNALGTNAIVPPELVYADLIASLDSRNLETAKLILQTEIANA